MELQPVSAIVHRCVTCGHIEQYHDQRERGTEVGCSYSWCPSGRHIIQLGDPVVIPTFDTAGNITPLHQPGSLLPPGEAGQPNPFGQLCGCGDCQQLFDSVAVAA